MFVFNKAYLGTGQRVRTLGDSTVRYDQILKVISHEGFEKPVSEFILSKGIFSQ